MTREELSNLTDDELLTEGKKMKTAALMHALLIGAMIGVVIYSIVKSTVGLFTLIPLFLIYKFTQKSSDHDELKAMLKERNLS